MKTLQQSLITATTQLTQAGIDTAALDARLLFQHVLQVPSEWLVAHAYAPLSEQQHANYERVISRRADHEPVPYILGYKDFWKDRFAVTPDTLIPRADSETLIEAALKIYQHKPAPRTILDLGTGSGCLLLSLLREFENARGMGVDISEGALRVARANAHSLGLSHRCDFFLADMTDESTLPETPRHVDTIISNPPYISSGEIANLAISVRDFEPRSALDGGMQGLNFYAALFNWLPKRMHDSSVVLFEVGQGQAPDVVALAAHDSTRNTQTYNDMASVARVVAWY